MINCKKCIYCITINRYDSSMKCKKFKGEIEEPEYCIYYKTLKEFAKEQAKKTK